MENKAVTQAARHTVATTSQSAGLASKNGLPSVNPRISQNTRKDLFLVLLISAYTLPKL